MTNKKILGIILSLVGAIGGIVSLLRISDDMEPQGLFDTYYTYQAPLTSHEQTMIFLVAVCAVSLIVGIWLFLSNKE